MAVVVASHRLAEATLRKQYGPDAIILDVTSHGQMPWVRFSPFYPVGQIPVPGSSGIFSASVEGIWQGLKVFENEGIDPGKFAITSMKGLKRGPSAARGRVLGHQAGVDSTQLLGYIVARYRIYLPSYLFVLENRLGTEVELLREKATNSRVVLLDYETNMDVEDPSRPLSHAGLIKCYIEGYWPRSPQTA